MLARTEFAKLPGWTDAQDQSAALKAFVASCGRLAKLPDATPLGKDGGVAAGFAKDWRNPCNEAMNTEPKDARAFFERQFAPYKISNSGNAEGLFTGYYEIGLEGSRTRKDQYRYPIYTLPDDVQRSGGKPYFSRAEIDGGSLRGRGLEMLYVSDPIALFFLHVQGSGRVKLPDGSLVAVTYAGTNGHPYRSIGAYLLEQGEFTRENINAPALKAWLYAHPDKMAEVMQQNPSYIFFREGSGNGPSGAQGAELTPEHSLAVDTAYIPFGLPLWLDSTLPVADKNGAAKPYRSLMIAQDTGSAIKGIVRGDVFFGRGQRAELLAGHMKQPGEYYALLPVKLPVK